MDRWAPLEPLKAHPSPSPSPGPSSSYNQFAPPKSAGGPTSSNSKRFSLNTAFSAVTSRTNAYAPASVGTGATFGSPVRERDANGGAAGAVGRYDDPITSTSGGGASSGTTSRIPLAFPIGSLPSSVVLRILSYVPLPTLAACAMASRNFARVVADEAIWNGRIMALGWRQVDGLPDPPEWSEIVKEELEEKKLEQSRHEEAKQMATAAEASAAGRLSLQHKQQPLRQPSTDDDFGDFTAAASGSGGPSSLPDDSFGAFVTSPATTTKAPTKITPGESLIGHGGSLANGFASVTIAGKTSVNGSITHRNGPHLAPSFAPLTPTAPSSHRSKGNSNAAIFSYAQEAKLPSATTLRSYRALRARVQQMKPFLSSFSSCSSGTSSLLFTTPALGLSSQPALLGNLLRLVSAPCLGVSIQTVARIWPRLVEAAQYLHGILLPAFEGAEARRADAVRAGRISGAEHTKRAVERAEKDMKQHAGAIWFLGQALERGNIDQQIREMDAVKAKSQGKDDDGPATADGNVFVISGSPPGSSHNLAAAASMGSINSHSSPGGDLDSIGISAAQSFLEKRDVFQGDAMLSSHDPSDNFLHTGSTSGPKLDFTAMDRFMSEILMTVKVEGSLIARVFPPEQDVVLAFADRIAGEVIADYVSPLLEQAKAVSTHTYVRACAATFSQALRLVDSLLEIEPSSEQLSQARCEDVIYRVWEPNMDEYLRSEHAWVEGEMRAVCEAWDRSLDAQDKADGDMAHVDAAFLASHNPAAVKRNFLTGFKDVLLAPVIVVPRAAVYVGGAAIRTAGTGLAQLNPMRWQSGTSSAAKPTGSPNPTRSSTPQPHSRPESEKGYVGFSSDGAPMTPSASSTVVDEKAEWASQVESRAGTPQQANHKRHSTLSASATKTRFARMQLLLSLDTALQLIQINRDCLRRIETFSKYPGQYGHRIGRETNDIAMSVFQYLGGHHVSPGFDKAKKQIEEWRPAEHEHDPESHVAPLVHFFELTHVGDTIQQMLQVYYDQELARHIDRDDFLNPVVREKKRFEAALDERVASGLNAGVDLLMGQAEHIISSLQDPRDYYPLPGSDMDLGAPTKACAECVRCLRTHCRMLAGSTEKNVLEVFYQEVGLRLYSIITKHLKRQIISLEGGFKVIADINAYHAFIASLKQPSVVVLFDGLKMLGNIYIIDSAKELGTIVRDANMFSGTLSPEDLYEFLQARCDFKSIESAIDKELYGFKVREDCSVM